MENFRKNFGTVDSHLIHTQENKTELDKRNWGRITPIVVHYHKTCIEKSTLTEPGKNDRTRAHLTVLTQKRILQALSKRVLFFGIFSKIPGKV